MRKLHSTLLSERSWISFKKIEDFSWYFLTSCYTNRLHEDAFFKLYSSLMWYFDRCFFSHRLGYVKPEAQAYKLALDYLALEPNQVVFIDDKRVNVDGAQLLGMHGIIAKNTEQITEELRNIDSFIF